VTNGQGCDGVRNAIALWCAFCCSSFDRYKKWAAVICRILECMTYYWISLPFAKASLPYWYVTNHFFCCFSSINCSQEQVKILIPEVPGGGAFFLLFLSCHLFFKGM
jgi:hypothetical protein